jgi:hypothetical protein
MGAGALTAQWPRKARRMSTAIAGTAGQRALLWTAARRRFGRELKDIVQALISGCRGGR